jgi:hypothetical protein
MGLRFLAQQKKKTKENNVDCARNMVSTSLRVFIKSERFNLDSGEDEIFFFAFRLSIYMPKWMDSAVRGRRDGLSQAAHGKRQRIYYGETKGNVATARRQQETSAVGAGVAVWVRA